MAWWRREASEVAQIKGSQTLGLPRDEVWRRLNDPDVLGEAIPGCQGMERIEGGDHDYRTAIRIAVGAVKGVYEGTVSYRDIEEPDRCTIVVEGKGDNGGISGSGEIVLAEAGDGTEVTYTGTYKLTGPVAGVGQRLAPGISRKMILETLNNIESPTGEDGVADTPAAGEGAAGTGAPKRSDEAFKPFEASRQLVFGAGLALGLVVGLIVGLVL